MGVFEDVFGGAIKPKGKFAVVDDDFQARYPILYALLAQTQDDSGKVRQTATLTIIAEDGVVKLGINERDHQLSLWTSSGSFLEAFTAMEEALNERPPRWRRKEWDGKRSRS